MKTRFFRVHSTEKFINVFHAAYGIPKDDIRKLLRNERKVLVSIYKKTGRYNLFIGTILLLMYALRRIGIGINFIQSAVLAAGIACVSIGGTGYAVYTTYQHFH